MCIARDRVLPCCCLVCWWSPRHGAVSFAGALGYSTLTYCSPVIWYLRVSSDHPSRTLPSPILVVETSEPADYGQKRMCADFGRVPGGEHAILNAAEHGAADDNRDTSRCTSRSRSSHTSYSNSPILRNQPLETQCWISAQFLSSY